MTESVGMTVVLLILAIIDIVGNVIVCAIIKRNRDMRYIFILFLFKMESLHNAHHGDRGKGPLYKESAYGEVELYDDTCFSQFFVKNTAFILAYINQNVSIKQKLSTNRDHRCAARIKTDDISL